MDTYSLILFFGGMLFFIRNVVISIQWISRRGTVHRLFSHKTGIIKNAIVFVTGLVFILSFNKCGFSYLWLFLGILFVFGSIVGLISVPFIYKTEIGEAYNKPSKIMRSLFVGQSGFGLLASIGLLCLWCYSWRHLISDL